MATAAALPTINDIHAASAVVYSTMQPTPQHEWPLLGRRIGAEVWVKHENHAPTGHSRCAAGSSTSRRCSARAPA